MHTNRSKNHGHVSVRYDRTFQGYLRIFAKAALRFTTQPAAVTGEASSNTFTGVYAYLRGRTHAKKVTNANLADLLFEATPYGRFIVMFRDPVSRYYSAHYYYRQSKEAQSTPQNFHDRAVR